MAGPPKRFAQAIGVVFSTTAVILWFGFGLATATWVVVALLACAATLESVFGICLGCIAFGFLMKAGVIPDEVCVACSDISLRHPQLSDATEPHPACRPAPGRRVLAQNRRGRSSAHRPASSSAQDT